MGKKSWKLQLEPHGTNVAYKCPYVWLAEASRKAVVTHLIYKAHDKELSAYSQWSNRISHISYSLE